MSAIDSDALKEYIKKTDLTAVERGALLQAISNMPTLTPPNEPLTWNELGNMVEKPVYIVELDEIIGVLQTKVNRKNEKSPAKFTRPKMGITKQAGEKSHRQPG